MLIYLLDSLIYLFRYSDLKYFFFELAEEHGNMRDVGTLKDVA